MNLALGRSLVELRCRSLYVRAFGFELFVSADTFAFERCRPKG